MTNNLFKNLWWRPPKFKTPEEMQEKIEDYFKCITLDKPDTYQERVWEELDLTDPEWKRMKWVYETREKLNNAWKPIIDTEWLEIPSILWLCIHIWLHRKNLIEYEKKDEFRNTIKAAKVIIERYNADQLHREKQVTWIIFNLKNNFDWKDKTEVDNNIKWNISLKDLHKSTQNDENWDSSKESKT